MVLDLGDDPSRLRPVPRLVREALVAHQWLAAGPSRGPHRAAGVVRMGRRDSCPFNRTLGQLLFHTSEHTFTKATFHENVSRHICYRASPGAVD